ncbi:hypothetical protein D8B26_006714 [Coccidioides posadasii str. Silveira]|uniref:Uncharacterized protein n=1 Tax=Coccidioides posadasii (strain RMSCC 757 / Silveira) TaxID=443226 RepID=E9CR78_COCPS|nr:hypothetical protein CPSG_01109 [Coccidioides posadasii str. Silveira]QVM12078.1 hypothetical protein D8B26_006714 [Coccidioides posadasii str. Silveira]
MVSRKRAREETEEHSVSAVDSGVSHEHGGLLHRLRNMWEFANLVEYIFLFGKSMKIDDDFDIEDLETECLKPGHSEKLLEIGLSLLKFVSSHRGLNRENFEEYTRRQYNAKAPGRNPFGDEEQPKKFHEFDMFEKIRILQQLATWTLWNPEKFRERMPEQKETEQTQWRIEELGYDRDERLYYLLDDNRLYRRTEPPIPPPRPAKPKANSKKGRAAARAAKRRKLAEDEVKREEDGQANGDATEDPSKGYKWECIAITLAEYNAFIEKLRKSKDPNEQILRDRIVNDVIPVIEKAEEAQQKKIQRREKELINLQKLATAKRSSRIANKQEKERQELLAAEEAKKHEAERIAEKKQQELREQIEKERIYRLMTREQRLKDREEKRRLHEEHLAKMEEQAKKLESGEARLSERQLKAMMEKGKQDLEALQGEESWFFDCSVCGVHGENLDDGTHSVACEKCNVWQHSQCLRIPKEEAEKDDFHFICADCQQRIEDAKRPKLPPLKFRILASASPPSAEATKANDEKRNRQPDESPVKKPKKPRPTPSAQAPASQPPGAPEMHPGVNGLAISQPQGTYFSPAQMIPNGIPGAHPSPRPVQNGTIYQPIQPQRLPPITAQPSHPGFPAHQVSAGQQPEPQLKFIQHYATPSQPHSTTTSFNSQRPSSSYSAHSNYRSPIQNRPSMSPTQGNRDVGPLAGFPPSATPDGAIPSTPFNHNQAHHVASSPYVNQTPSASFSATPRASFAHTPPPNYSQPVAMSGLSPTKQSPPRAPLAFSPNIGHTAILPPVQKLHPSPKLMGRSSPDAPIPAPVKSMTPEQEDRRRREMEFSAQNLARSSGPSDSPLPRPPILHPTQPLPHQAGAAIDRSFSGGSSK